MNIIMVKVGIIFFLYGEGMMNKVVEGGREGGRICFFFIIIVFDYIVCSNYIGY